MREESRGACNFHGIHYGPSHLSFKRLSIRDFVHIFAVAFHGFVLCLLDTSRLYSAFSMSSSYSFAQWDAYFLFNGTHTGAIVIRSSFTANISIVHLFLSICCQCAGFLPTLLALLPTPPNPFLLRLQIFPRTPLSARSGLEACYAAKCRHVCRCVCVCL